MPGISSHRVWIPHRSSRFQRRQTAGSTGTAGSTYSSGTGSINTGSASMSYSYSYSGSTVQQSATPSPSAGSNAWHQGNEQQNFHLMHSVSVFDPVHPMFRKPSSPNPASYPFKSSGCYYVKLAVTNATMSICENCIPGITTAAVFQSGAVSNNANIWCPTKLKDNVSFTLAAKSTKNLFQVETSRFISTKIPVNALIVESKTVNSSSTWTWKSGTKPNTFQFRLVQSATSWLGACVSCNWTSSHNYIPAAYGDEGLINNNPEYFDFYVIPV